MRYYVLTDGQLADVLGAAWSAARGKRDTDQYPLVAHAWITHMLDRLELHGPVVQSAEHFAEAIAAMRHWQPQHTTKVLVWKQQA